MQVALAGSNYKRSYGTSYQRLENLLVEPTPNGPPLRFSRGGLVEAYTLGVGPVRGLYSVSGLFNSDVFAVSGTTLYRNQSSVGPIPGTDDVRWASSSDQLVIVANGLVWLYEAGTLSPIITPDSQLISDVVYLAGRFVYSVSGTGRFYWSGVNDAASINGLDFATAESSADSISGMGTLVDDLYLFGAGQSTEIWAASTDADAPFQRPQGRKYNRGCASRDSIAYADNALFWVGENRIVYRTGAVPERVSDFSIEERLSNCTNISACVGWSITREGHELYVLNIPDQGSFCLDLSNKKWTEWTSYGQGSFRGRCAQMVNGAAYIGDIVSGRVGILQTASYTDYEAPITWLASFWIDQPGGVASLNNLVLQGARGVGLTDGLDPVTVIRFSSDQGKTFTNWEPAELGRIGEYSDRAVWQRLGKIAEPGLYGEVRTTSPVLCSMLQMLANVPRPYG